jgi:hypothetical protein
MCKAMKAAGFAVGAWLASLSPAWGQAGGPVIVLGEKAGGAATQPAPAGGAGAAGGGNVVVGGGNVVVGGGNVVVGGNVVMGNVAVQVNAVGGAAPVAAGDSNAGAMSEAREDLAAVLKLVAPDGKIALDREAWKEKEENKGDDPKVGGGGMVAGGGAVVMIARMPGQSDLAKLLTKVFSRSGSRRGSMSMGGGREQGSFGGGALEGSYTSQENSLELTITERQAPGRMLRFRNGEDGLSIQLLDGASDQVILLNQTADGAIRLLHVRGEEVVRAKAANYHALCRDRREYVDKTLRAALEGVGVPLPMSAWSEPVRSAVLEILKAPKPAAVAELIAKLDAEKAADREAATKALSAAYLACHKELKAALDSNTASAEVKSRIQEIFRQNQSKLEPAALVDALHLLQDAELLTDMLKNAKSDEDKKVLTEALAKLRK